MLVTFGASFAMMASQAQGQGPPQIGQKMEMQAQIQNIVRDRPREAEAAARAFLHLIGLREEPAGQVEQQLATLDSLKAAAPDVYWTEVGQLTVQFDMVQQLARRDSARAELVTRMFGLESSARAIQRAYRAATESQRAILRRRLEGYIDRHFDVENALRELEIADIERRLAQAREETRRRLDRAKRADLVKWAVDDIIRDATRPE
jgi:hypothetical protein